MSANSSDIVPPPPIAQPFWHVLIQSGLIVLVFYFLILRPKAKKAAETKEMLASIKKGEEIMTSSGIFGTVHSIVDNDVVQMKIADSVVIKIARSAIIAIPSRSNNKQK